MCITRIVLDGYDIAMSLLLPAVPRQHWQSRFLVGPACLTGSQYGFFSVHLQLEGRCQMQGGLVERQLVHRCPKIKNIALLGTVGMETLKHVFAEMR